MLKQKEVLGKFLAAAMCLSGFSAISHDAVAGGWVESGRTAYYKNSFFGSFDGYACSVGGPDFADFPGSCPNDGASGWNGNFNASFNLSSSDLNICNSIRTRPAPYVTPRPMRSTARPSAAVCRPTAPSVPTRWLRGDARRRSSSSTKNWMSKRASKRESMSASKTGRSS